MFWLVDCGLKRSVLGAEGEMKKAEFVFSQWTDGETLCSAIPMGLIEASGRTDPHYFDFPGTQKLFSSIQQDLSQNESLGCAGAAGL